MEFKHSCGAVIDMTGESVGKKITCPQCKTSLTLVRASAKQVPRSQLGAHPRGTCVYCLKRRAAAGRTLIVRLRKKHGGKSGIVEVRLPYCESCSNLHHASFRRTTFYALPATVILLGLVVLGFIAMFAPHLVDAKRSPWFGTAVGISAVCGMVLAAIALLRRDRRTRKQGSRPFSGAFEFYGPIKSLINKRWVLAVLSQGRRKWDVADYEDAVVLLGRDVDRPRPLEILDMPEEGPVAVLELPEGEWPGGMGLFAFEAYLCQLAREIIVRWSTATLQEVRRKVEERAGPVAREELEDIWSGIGGWEPEKEAE